MFFFELDNLSNASINQPMGLFLLISKNSISFAWTCLPIGENSAIETFIKFLAHLHANSLENHLLVDFLVEYLVETKIVVLDFGCFLI